MNQERYNWIDVVKGISICFVMFEHVKGNYSMFRNWFSLFYVTTFLVLSGYLFYIKKKDSSAIKPMLKKLEYHICGLVFLQ